MPRSLSVALSLSITHLLVGYKLLSNGISSCHVACFTAVSDCCVSMLTSFVFGSASTFAVGSIAVILLMVVTQAEQAIFGTLS